jgi:hypothetical protein
MSTMQREWGRLEQENQRHSRDRAALDLVMMKVRGAPALSNSEAPQGVQERCWPILNAEQVTA